jgi:gamma-glutamylcyclotransferase (GGCT)/AIG2-like uncharacterized protein YtfP
MGIHIFTYGSLMFHRVWSRVAAGDYEKKDARLYGYKRRKIRGAIYPAVLPGTDLDYVDGIVYLNVSESDVKALDKFEGEYYHKETAECELSDRAKISVCVYVFSDKYRNLIENKEWDPVWFSRVGIHSFLTLYEGFD